MEGGDVEVHALNDQTGRQFQLHLDESSRIVDVVGEWPEGEEEFRLEGPLPPHVDVDGAPDHVVAEAAKRGLTVCYYDDTRCQTCYCDKEGNIMYCRGMC
jgi:hypothetical protein